MDPIVFAAVLVAAACHAGWNAALKVVIDPFATTALIAIMSALQAVVLVPLVGLPAWESWPWLLASVIVHLGYYIGLTEAYRTGDMGQVYPVARGSAPLMTAIASAVVIGEYVGTLAWIGIVVLTLGVMLLSTHGGRDLVRIDRRALGFAFFTATTICAYSLVDGLGGRISGNPLGYAILLFVLDGLAMLCFVVIRRGPGILPVLMGHAKIGFAGGLLSLIAYTVAIWAMTKAPIAIVAALRETSVLFGALIAVLVLKEPLRAARIAAAIMIVCGLVLIRLT